MITEIAIITIDPTNGGKAPTFNGAWLQGVNAAGLGKSMLAGAFVDFGVTTDGKLRVGNTMHVLLSTDYTRFRNWNGASTTPCVRLRYDTASVLPTDVGTMTCPNGLVYPGKGCGPLASKGDPATPLNPAWNGGEVVKSQPPGWYQEDSTYEGKTSSPVSATILPTFCNGHPEDRTWFSVSPPP